MFSLRNKKIKFSFHIKSLNYGKVLLIRLVISNINIKSLREHSGSVVECLTRNRGQGFEPHRRHCVVVLEQDLFILA